MPSAPAGELVDNRSTERLLILYSAPGIALAVAAALAEAAGAAPEATVVATQVGDELGGANSLPPHFPKDAAGLRLCAGAIREEAAEKEKRGPLSSPPFPSPPL